MVTGNYGGQAADRTSCSYLLRCWPEPGAGPAGTPAWRFTLTRLGADRHEVPLASLEDVYDQLLAELARAAAGAAAGACS